ncbi:MAG: AAA family ATPase [Alphaproteobacteria bacterium]|nr:AAA family ATPase [Alphaproteobacteria bacterium]
MYAKHFGFSADPFQLTADQKLFYRSSGHGKALAYLSYGISQGEGFIVVTGEVGAGKTTIIQYLLDHLDRDKYVAAQIVTTSLRGDDMIQAIATSFGLTVTNWQKAAVLRQLEQFLIETRRRGKRSVLVVDECQNLSFEAVEELRMLSNFQLDNRPLLQSFLVGQPQFRHILSSPDLEQLRQRVTASCHLGPMTEAETKEYIEHRLRSVGWAGKPSFSADAHVAIFRDTDGVPRKINRLCSRVFLACCLDQLTAIDGKLVSQTAQDLARELGVPVESAGTAAPPPAPAQTPAPAAPSAGTSAAPGPAVAAAPARGATPPPNGADPAHMVNGAQVEQRLSQVEDRLERMETIADRLHAASKALAEKLRSGAG